MLSGCNTTAMRCTDDAHGSGVNVRLNHHARVGCMNWGWKLLVVACVVMLQGTQVTSQWALGTPKFNEVFAANLAAQREELIAGPYVVQQLNPSQFMIDIDTYQFAPFAAKQPDYRMNVMINPCEGHEFNCCYDIFGTPEYRFEVTDPFDPDFGKSVQLFTDGARIDPEASRVPDDAVIINEDCVGLIDPEFNCVGFRSFKQEFSELPVCWDRNATVNGLGGCRNPTDGSAMEFCIELAFTQTALVVECGNEFLDDPHCGTFLEIHKPDDPIILSEIKLRGQFMSGYRQTVMSTNVMGRTDIVLCRGSHQIWWVQRTRYNFVIEFKKTFFIDTPDCDWDETNDRPFVYTALGGVNARLALQGTDEEVDVATWPTNIGDITLPDPTGGILYFANQYDKYSADGQANEPDAWGR